LLAVGGGIGPGRRRGNDQADEYRRNPTHSRHGWQHRISARRTDKLLRWRSRSAMAKAIA